jgi:F-type H+-transporting ATPase subunit b
MQIDWITVAAQVVNFLVLVWLLKRFLYQPVVRAMRRREDHIAERLNDADVKLKEAQEKAEAFELKQRELESARERLMGEAREEVEQERKVLREKMRAEIKEERREWQLQAQRERESFVRDLRSQIASQFESLAGNALRDLADRSLEEQIGRHLAQRLDDLEEEEANSIHKAAQKAGGGLHVLSSFELSAEVRRGLTRSLHERFGEDLDVDYQTSDDLDCGIEIQTAGRSIMWSLDSYLDEFQQTLGARLQEMSAKASEDEAA